MPGIDKYKELCGSYAQHLEGTINKALGEDDEKIKALAKDVVSGKGKVDLTLLTDVNKLKTFNSNKDVGKTIMKLSSNIKDELADLNKATKENKATKFVDENPFINAGNPYEEEDKKSVASNSTPANRQDQKTDQATIDAVLKYALIVQLQNDLINGGNSKLTKFSDHFKDAKGTLSLHRSEGLYGRAVGIFFKPHGQGFVEAVDNELKQEQVMQSGSTLSN